MQSYKKKIKLKNVQSENIVLPTTQRDLGRIWSGERVRGVKGGRGKDLQTPMQEELKGDFISTENRRNHSTERPDRKEERVVRGSFKRRDRELRAQKGRRNWGVAPRWPAWGRSHSGAVSENRKETKQIRWMEGFDKGGLKIIQQAHRIP